MRGFPSLPARALLAALVLSFSSCTTQETLRARHRESPVTRAPYWGEGWKSRPLWQRVGPAPPEVVAYIGIENELSGYAERPVSAAPPPVFAEALGAIASILPAPVRRLAEESVIGVFSVEELGGTGYAEVVRNEQGREAYAFIVLDREVLLSRTANQWATWKENSVFRPSAAGAYRLEARIEEDDNDTVANAVRFILLHELGHVLGMASGVHPSWDPAAPAGPVRLPFPRLSWRTGGEGKIVSIFDDAFPERASLRYYAFEEASLSAGQMPAVYRRFRDQTNFASLYASVSQWEDFAESFATYVHVVREDRPWSVMIVPPGGPPVTYGSCWREDRCREKKNFMARWFADPLGVR